ncbi:hypothetical protein L1987_65041 [Smallanthus sonchifolius]|uniref:Uncharacterized protein n=1 Tax=Smallanthus sonchifolius TaxID=185202 RepID=A0ACB9BTH2_9ASTR|nr:hypothetical protein L1987_65041 [Smallanthus sonchifolius]
MTRSSCHLINPSTNTNTNTNTTASTLNDSFVTHRAFCDALTEENSRMASFPMMSSAANLKFGQDLMTLNGGGGGGKQFPGMFGGEMLETNLDANSAKPRLPIWLENLSNSSFMGSSSSNNNNGGMQFNSLYNNYTSSTTTTPPPTAHMSATPLLQKAAQQKALISLILTGLVFGAN